MMTSLKFPFGKLIMVIKRNLNDNTNTNSEFKHNGNANDSAFLNPPSFDLKAEQQQSHVLFLFISCDFVEITFVICILYSLKTAGVTPMPRKLCVTEEIISAEKSSTKAVVV
jgi:hypothetical protein